MFLEINGEYINFSTIGTITYSQEGLSIIYQTEGGRVLRQYFDTEDDFLAKKTEIESIGA